MRGFVGELEPEVADAGGPPALEKVRSALRLGVEDRVAAALVRQHEVVRPLVVAQVHLVRLARLAAVPLAAKTKAKNKKNNHKII